jgi:hypothetical protein
MPHDIKHLSFQFIIPNEFFNISVKVTVPYEITVRYALHWNKKVDLEGYTIKPGMAKWITNWQGMEDQMQAAAENNSKLYKLPGQYGGIKMRPEGLDPYQDIHDQWKMEAKQH